MGNIASYKTCKYLSGKKHDCIETLKDAYYDNNGVLTKVISKAYTRLYEREDYNCPAYLMSDIQRWLRESFRIVAFVAPKRHLYFEYEIITIDNHIIGDRDTNWDELLDKALYEGVKLTSQYDEV